MFELTRNANNSPWGQGVAEILLVFYVHKRVGWGEIRLAIDGPAQAKKSGAPKCAAVLVIL
jgi:hypothetical protein